MGISAIAAVVSAVAAVGGTVMSAAGAANSAASQEAAANYNAQVAQVQATNAQQQAAAQSQQVAQNTTRQMGQAAAAYGAGGVDMQGSPLAVMSDLATQGELSKRLTIYQGTVQAQSDQQQAGVDIATGQNAATAGTTKVAGTILTGLSNTTRIVQPFLSNTQPISPLAPSDNPSYAGASPAGGLT